METLDSVNREGRERLYPSLTNPSWLILRKRREMFRKWLAGLEGRELRVLDLGGRIQPYRPLLEGRIRSYVAVDLRRTPLVSIVGRGEQIPLADASFDLAICTQVLQYVSEPAVVVAEIHRVLRKGGVLLLSAPAVYPRETDRDMWRFSPANLRALLHDFCDVGVMAEGSSISGLFRTICVFLVTFARRAFFAACMRVTLVPLLNIMAAWLESLRTESDDRFSANFSAFARK